MTRTAARVALALAAALLLLLGLAACAQHLRLSVGAATGAPPPEGALRLGTHNVHYIDLRAQDGPWSLAGWERRRDALDAAFKALGGDAVAFQEMESWGGGSESRENLALDWLLARNPGYAAAAVGDPATFPSTQPILYRRARLTPLGQGWFFFSETPEAIYSRGFDGAPPSFASWARFRDRTSGVAFTLVNVHLDAGSWQNRRGGAELVAAFARPRIAAGERIVVLGDLNALQGSATMVVLENAGLRFPSVPGATFHMNRGLHLFGAIDHVGLGPTIEAIGPPAVLRLSRGGIWPSDHHPVLVDMMMR